MQKFVIICPQEISLRGGVNPELYIEKIGFICRQGFLSRNLNGPVEQPNLHMRCFQEDKF